MSNNWFQRQTQIQLSRQDVIQRQAFDNLVGDVISDIKEFEDALRNRKSSKRLSKLNGDVLGCINCLGFAFSDWKDDKKAIKLGISRIIPYYLKMSNEKDLIIKQQILPLILLLVKMFKEKKHEVLPPPKLTNFNEIIFEKAMSKYGEGLKQIEDEMTEIKKNYQEYDKRQNNIANSKETKKNINVFDNIKINNNDVSYDKLYSKMDKKDINFNYKEEIHQETQKHIEDELWGHNPNDFNTNNSNNNNSNDNNSNDNNSNGKDNDNDVDMSKNKYQNGILKSSFYTIKELKKLKKGDSIDYKSDDWRYYQSKIVRINNSDCFFFVKYMNEKKNEIITAVQFKESQHKFAKYKSITELKSRRFNNIKINDKLYLHCSYFGLKSSEQYINNYWIPIIVSGGFQSQMKFKYGNGFEKWIHLNDTRLQTKPL